MCAAPDELSFRSPCDKGARWKILSSFLRDAANFDGRGKMKEERPDAREANKFGSRFSAVRAPLRLKWAEARERR